MGLVPAEIKHFGYYERRLYPVYISEIDAIILHNDVVKGHWTTKEQNDIPINLKNMFTFGWSVNNFTPISNLAILLHTDLTPEQFYDKISNV